MVDNFTSSDADIGRFLGRSPWPCHTRGQCLQFGLGGRKQFLALEPTLLGQLGVVASHQPFAGEVWGSDLSQAYGHEILSDQVTVGQQAADRAATQRRDPAQARVLLEHINLSLCEHTTIANQHYARETKPLREGLDLVGNRLGIAGVAGIDLYGDRPSIGVGQQTVDDDRAAGLAVAVVAEAGQRACLPLVVAAGDVVEHHRPFAEVPAGELFLDRLLPQEQPIHGVVEVIFGGVDDIQLLGQGGAVPVPGVGQLGAGEEQALGDHGDHQVAPSRGLGRDEFLHSELANHRQHGIDMAMRQRAGDAEGLGRGHERLALEGAFDDLDEVIGKMGKVAEGLMGDGLSLADGSSKQMGDVGPSLVDPPGRSHMNGAASCWHAAIF